VARALPTALLAALTLAAAPMLAAAPAARAAATPERPGQTFTVAWGGDLTPGSSYGSPPAAGRTMLAAIAEPLRRADVAAVNLEGTLGRGGPAKCANGVSSTCYAFQAPAANALALADPGIDVVNVANNHAFDFGAIGARLTQDALRRHGIRSTGRAGQIAYLDLPRSRVAFVGFAAYPWAAPIRDLGAVRALVAEAARHANVVVAFVHAGAEGAGQVHTPDRDEEAFGERRGNPRAFAHAAVRAGADLVLGSGPHVLRGMELFRGRMIAYSLGNLAGYRNFALGGRSGLSGLLTVRVGPQGGFGAGAFTSLRLTGPGLPRLDPSGAAARLVSAVSRQDFGARAVRIGRDGALSAAR
jgi:poly-gamma-glutamate capsule biosynthesis protein CapA/YwtB (metallophosphatase superfamily)